MNYSELVKRIHSQAVYLPEKFSKNAELLDVLMKAADAIEELQKHYCRHAIHNKHDRGDDSLCDVLMTEPPKEKTE